MFALFNLDAKRTPALQLGCGVASARISSVEGWDGMFEPNYQRHSTLKGDKLPKA